MYALAAAGAANFATHPSRTLWAPFMRLTFGIVHWILKALLPVVSTDLSIMRIWTPTFGVRIAADRGGGRRTQPAGEARPGLDELAEGQVEGQHEAHRRERHEEDEGSRSGQRRDEQVGEEPSDSTATPPAGDLDGAEHADVGNDDPHDRGAPAR